MLPAKRFNGQSWLPDFFNDLFEGNAIDRLNSNAPAINVKETDTNYHLEVAAPGMTKEDFNVHVNKDGNLVIEMEKKNEAKEEKEGRYLRHEFSYTKFHQTLILPENAERNKIEACVKNGVLNVNVPKVAKTKVEDEKRVIEVK